MLLFSLLSHLGWGAVISQGTHLRCWGFRMWPSTYTISHFRTALAGESDGGRKGEEGRGADKALKRPNSMGSVSPDTTKDSQEETPPQCKKQSGYTRQPHAGDGCEPLLSLV